MHVLFILISLSSVVALFFLFAFIWSVKTGQYDDGYTPAVRILFEDAKPENTESEIDEHLSENK